MVSYTEEGIVLSDGTVIDWETINQEQAKIKFSNYVLVSSSFSYGRSSYFQTSFLLPQSEWEDVKKKMMGKTIYLGEIAGKYSEVCWDFTEDNFKETKDINDIYSFHKGNGFNSGNVDLIGRIWDQIWEEED